MGNYFTRNKKCICFLFLMLFAFVGIAQESLEQPITITFNKIKLKKALSKLEQQTSMTFAYNNIHSLSQKVKKSYTNKPLKTILNDLLTPKGLGYQIIGKQVAIFKLKTLVPSSKTTQEEIGHLPNIKLQFSGYIYDTDTQEPIIGASVYDKKTQAGNSTDIAGFFELTLLGDGRHIIVVSYIGYRSKEIEVTKEEEIIILLEPDTETLSVVEVTDNEKVDRSIHNTQMGVSALAQEQLKDIPSMAGETDIIKGLTLLPGIGTGQEGTANLYVRGGSIDQNLILLDGIPLYNPYHLFGVLSAFNVDAIGGVEISKGGFPARYSGRLSSVLDMSMSDGDIGKWETKIDIGILAAKAMVRGPIYKDKSSILFSVRRSYIEGILAGLDGLYNIFEDEDLKLRYSLTDYNLKWDYKISDNDKLSINSYFSQDPLLYKQNYYTDNERYEYNNDFVNLDAKYNNGLIGIHWEHIFNAKFFSKTSLYYTHYSYNYDFLSATRKKQIRGAERHDEIYRYFRSSIDDIGFKYDFQYHPNDKHQFRFGINTITHLYNLGVDAYSIRQNRVQEGNRYLVTDGDREVLETSLYIEDEWELRPTLKVNVGVNATAFWVKGKAYFSLQPRLSGRYLLNDKSSVKLSYTRMAQNTHLLSSGEYILKTDFWVPTTARIQPETSEQFGLGYHTKLGNQFAVEMETYYKTMDNLTEYRPGRSLLLHNGNWEDIILIGEGESYGAEFLIRKTKGKLTGWLAYTLSWSFRQFDELNFGKKYYDVYDRRHDISINLNYQLNKKWSFNTTWVFNSGGFTNLAYEAYLPLDTSNEFLNGTYGNINFSSNGILIEDLGTSSAFDFIPSSYLIVASYLKNSFRLPDYHRMDIAFIRKKTTKRGNTTELTLGISNVYNKKNPTFFTENRGNFQYNGVNYVNVEYEGFALFPFLPSVNYSITF